MIQTHFADVELDNSSSTNFEQNMIGTGYVRQELSGIHEVPLYGFENITFLGAYEHKLPGTTLSPSPPHRTLDIPAGTQFHSLCPHHS